MHHMRLTLLVLAALALMSFEKFSHSNCIAGVVRDMSTRQPIPFANIHFKGTVIGTRSDEKGCFLIKCKARLDSVTISAIGYKTAVVPIGAFTVPTYEVLLEEEAYTLKEVIVRPRENPAHPSVC